MPRVTLTIHIDYDQRGASVSVDQSKTIGPGESPLDGGPDISDWPVEVIPVPGDAPRAPQSHAAAPIATSVPSCPTHRVVMVMKPAGVSKKTGNAYAAFWACPERDCKQTWNPPR